MFSLSKSGICKIWYRGFHRANLVSQALVHLSDGSRFHWFVADSCRVNLNSWPCSSKNNQWPMWSALLFFTCSFLRSSPNLTKGCRSQTFEFEEQWPICWQQQCWLSCCIHVASSIAQTPHCPYSDKKTPKCKHRLKCRTIVSTPHCIMMIFRRQPLWVILRSGSFSYNSTTFIS